jgi:hypothetical protein
VTLLARHDPQARYPVVDRARVRYLEKMTKHLVVEHEESASLPIIRALDAARSCIRRHARGF